MILYYSTFFKKRQSCPAGSFAGRSAVLPAAARLFCGAPGPARFVESARRAPPSGPQAVTVPAWGMPAGGVPDGQPMRPRQNGNGFYPFPF